MFRTDAGLTGVAIDCGVWPFSQGHWNWQRCLTSVCGTFERRSSRRDGVTIAQRFIAGKQEPAQNHSPIGTAETCRRFRSSLRDLVLRVSPVPALKCRAILKCPYGTASRLGSGKSVPQSMVTPRSDLPPFHVPAVVRVISSVFKIGSSFFAEGVKATEEGA